METLIFRTLHGELLERATHDMRNIVISRKGTVIPPEIRERIASRITAGRRRRVARRSGSIAVLRRAALDT